jgi:hypothetical protein
MKTFLHQDSLSIVFVLIFVGALTGQILFGIKEYSREPEEQHTTVTTLPDYLLSEQFIEYTFEKGESKFLQMGLFLWLTVFLMRIGSPKSVPVIPPDHNEKRKQGSIILNE